MCNYSVRMENRQIQDAHALSLRLLVYLLHITTKLLNTITINVASFRAFLMRLVRTNHIIG